MAFAYGKLFVVITFFSTMIEASLGRKRWNPCVVPQGLFHGVL